MSEILESEIVQSMDDDGPYSAPLEIQSSEVDALHNANKVGLDLEENESNNTKEQSCLVGQPGEENLTSNAKKDHIINGKHALQSREEIINVHLANISMDDIEALLKDEIIEDMYQDIDKNDVSVETFYDDQPQVQPNGLHQLDLSIDLSDQRSYILYSLRPITKKNS